MALMGHSMGATIAPLALAFEPRYRVGLLSGAGASWIENVIYKSCRLPVLPASPRCCSAYASRGYDAQRARPGALDVPVGGRAADPHVYARRIMREPTDGAPPRTCS